MSVIFMGEIVPVWLVDFTCDGSAEPILQTVARSTPQLVDQVEVHEVVVTKLP